MTADALTPAGPTPPAGPAGPTPPAPPAGRTGPAGLTSAEAERRLARDGPNRIPPPRRPSAVRRLLAELTHAFAIMLWTASGLAVLAGLPELSVAIAGVVVLNALFAFWQRTRADQAAERLRALLPTRVSVLRDGRRRIVEADDVVVGDLLLLEAGDRVPADAVVVGAHRLLLDTSMLTGESEPSSPGPGDVLFGGPFLVEGEGRAEVTATGGGTRLAGIARLATAPRHEETPLTRELRRVVHLIAAIAVGVGALAQTANAFACRSSTRWPGALGWTTNRLLVPAASTELVFSFVVLLVSPFALALGHASPPPAGWAVAVGSAGVLLAVDAADKAWRRRGAVPDGGPRRTP